MTQYDAINSGVSWIDNQGKAVSARGACIVKDRDKYYLFGEYKTDSANVFNGFACYSSKDLYNWTFERMALPVQVSGKLGKKRVGERPKVMRSTHTGEYVMYMHVDSLNYKDQFVGYATSKSITGPYTYQGALLYNDNPIKKWDLGSFQDDNGDGYILIHGGEIYKLNDDYKSVKSKINEKIASGFESPTMLKKDNLYYFLGSNLTSWERNDNYYYTSPSLSGPWTKQGYFAPQGSNTWNSQCTFVLPIKGDKTTTYMYMGDRWSFPKQNSAATYVWQPLKFNGNQLSMPKYVESWEIDLNSGIHKEIAASKYHSTTNSNSDIKFNGSWQKINDEGTYSNIKGDKLIIPFNGQRIKIYGASNLNSGYAKFSLFDGRGNLLYENIVDMYALANHVELKYISPILSKEDYELIIEVMGEGGIWSDKRRNGYGSKGNNVTISGFKIL
ncbi:family 43 glycosylhydrolase [Sphingobacterium sp. WQ 366]|uniref:Family 43 glycosylhydrolase n=2 Tax=Sphingobacterium bovistauri TaxID=2781959 RepID=A0ABS7Z099_9SPHI|nr:family 43 glycosylhydrolase [Sphingobacterium bovistauri]